MGSNKSMKIDYEDSEISQIRQQQDQDQISQESFNYVREVQIDEEQSQMSNYRQTISEQDQTIQSQQQQIKVLRDNIWNHQRFANMAEMIMKNPNNAISDGLIHIKDFIKIQTDKILRNVKNEFKKRPDYQNNQMNCQQSQQIFQNRQSKSQIPQNNHQKLLKELFDDRMKSLQKQKVKRQPSATVKAFSVIDIKKESGQTDSLKSITVQQKDKKNLKISPKKPIQIEEEKVAIDKKEKIPDIKININVDQIQISQNSSQVVQNSFPQTIQSIVPQNNNQIVQNQIPYKINQIIQTPVPQQNQIVQNQALQNNNKNNFEKMNQEEQKNLQEDKSIVDILSKIENVIDDYYKQLNSQDQNPQQNVQVQIQNVQSDDDGFQCDMDEFSDVIFKSPNDNFVQLNNEFNQQQIILLSKAQGLQNQKNKLLTTPQIDGIRYDQTYPRSHMVKIQKQDIGIQTIDDKKYISIQQANQMEKLIKNINQLIKNKELNEFIQMYSSYQILKKKAEDVYQRPLTPKNFVEVTRMAITSSPMAIYGLPNQVYIPSKNPQQYQQKSELHQFLNKIQRLEDKIKEMKKQMKESQVNSVKESEFVIFVFQKMKDFMVLHKFIDKQLHLMQKNVVVLANKINEQLYINKYNDQEKLNNQIQQLNILDIFNYAYEILFYGAKMKKIGMFIEFDESEYYELQNIRINFQVFIQIIMNFISNSIKFTPKNGRIKISLKVMKQKIFLNQISMKDIDPIIDSQESLISENQELQDFNFQKNNQDQFKDSLLQITIQDTGAGISQNLIDQLIIKDYKSLIPHKFIDNKGRGFGLFVAQRLIQQVGGNLKVVSKQGFGSKFIITLKIEAKYEQKVKNIFQGEKQKPQQVVFSQYFSQNFKKVENFKNLNQIMLDQEDSINNIKDEDKQLWVFDNSEQIQIDLNNYEQQIEEQIKLLKNDKKNKQLKLIEEQLF